MKDFVRKLKNKFTVACLGMRAFMGFYPNFNPTLILRIPFPGFRFQRFSLSTHRFSKLSLKPRGIFYPIIQTLFANFFTQYQISGALCSLPEWAQLLCHKIIANSLFENTPFSHYHHRYACSYSQNESAKINYCLAYQS